MHGKRLAVEHRTGRRQRRRAGRGPKHVDQLRKRDRLQLVEPVRGDLQALQHLLGRLHRLLGRDRCKGRAALRNRPVKQAAGRRHRHERADLPTTAGLPEDRDVAGVATERGDVVAHEFQCRDDIEHANVGGGRPLAAVLGQVQEAEQVQAVVDRDRHHVVLPREFPALVDPVAARTAAKAAAVQPHHDRPASRGRIRRPDVHDQAVFAKRLARVGRQHLRRLTAKDLRRAFAPPCRLAHTGPRLALLRREESTGAGGRGRVRHSLEDVYAVVDVAAQRPGRGPHGCARRARLRR